jgi:sugar phosphate isomerase/epimerase
MTFALSTNWNSPRHADGEAIVDEILSLGFTRVEIGYQFQETQVPGLLRRIRDGATAADSVHAYSPVPLGAPNGHPELFLLAAPEEDTRRLAIFHMRRTLDLAATIGARAVISHAGRVPVGRRWARLANELSTDNTEHWRYRWNLRRLVQARQRRIGRHLDALRRSLDELLPHFGQAGVALALENLPSYDALPDAEEMLQLAVQYPDSMLRYWHDIGHGQIMANAGFADPIETTRRLLSLIAGVHIHDVRGPMLDHQAPGDGGIDFSRYGFLADPAILHVFEPAATVTPEALKSGLSHLRLAWAIPAPPSKGKAFT